MPRAREWRLHIGAHKTATTHFQATLAQYRPALLEAGIDFIPHKSIRSARLGKHVLRPHQRLPFFHGFIGRTAFERTLNPLRQGPPVVAISEENLIGGSRDLLGDRFYANAADRLSLLEAIARVSKVTLFLAVRRLDEILPAAYVQTLKDRAPNGSAKPSFEPIRVNALASPPTWFELVARVKREVPSATLKIWKFEDYVRHEAEVLASFCGANLRKDESLPVPTRTRTPSAEVVAELESLDPRMPPAQRKSIVDRIRNEADDMPKYRPFSSEERRRLGDVYEEDIDNIRTVFPDVILDF
jgi:hypothetical protein